MSDEFVMPEWKQIAGYSRYEICGQGYIRERVTDNLVKPITLPYGQQIVRIQADDLSWHDVLVHKLVADTFIDNPDEYSIVCHKDDNPLNNNQDNLEWSPEQRGTMPFSKSDLTSPIYCYETDEIYDNAIAAAREFGCGLYDIARVCISDNDGLDGYYHFCFVKDIHK